MTMIVMLNNTIEYDEVRFHERHDSIISAVRSFATKLASAVDQAVVALILIISNIYAISQKISDVYKRQILLVDFGSIPVSKSEFFTISSINVWYSSPG